LKGSPASAAEGRYGEVSPKLVRNARERRRKGVEEDPKGRTGAKGKG
jgi:hypothetical protein